ncbi:MAG: SRPBCC family protein [Thermoanaerobaculia bacterium]
MSLPMDEERPTEARLPFSRNVEPTERVVSMAVGAALVGFGLATRRPASRLLTLAGGALIARGFFGWCPVNLALGREAGGTGQAEAAVLEHGHGFDVRKQVTIARSPAELYAFWRNLENLPHFMEHLRSVRVIDEKRSHWVADAPAGRSIEWDAEIINDVPGERIGWKSLPGSEVTHAGSVEFVKAPGDQGTEVTVHLRYDPPLGRVGAATARLFRRSPAQQVGDELRRFKQLTEAGEIPTTEGQPSGRATGE